MIGPVIDAPSLERTDVSSNSSPLAPSQDPWHTDLGHDQILRQAERRDRLALSWLLGTGAHVHDVPGHESLRDLLREQSSMVWLSGSTIRGSLLPSPNRKPVALVRHLAIRNSSDRALFIETILGHMESRLAELAFQWLAFHRCPAWLVDEITRNGYAIQDRIVGYRLLHIQATAIETGSPSIRRATVADVPSVLAVDWAAFAPFWRLNRLNIRRSAQQCPYFFLIGDDARADGQVSAYLMAERLGAQGYVSRIAVHPDHQNQGLGSALMWHALAVMARDGLRSVELDTQETNMRSQALYEKLGFEPLGQVDVYWAKSLV